METIRMHVYISGRVQGVGYRFTACRLARPLGLTGWVKNLWDGRVEMEVQGERTAVERLLRYLPMERFIRVDSMDTKEISLKEGERDFREIY